MGEHFVTFCLLSSTLSSFWKKMSSLKESMGSDFFPFRADTFSKKGQKQFW